jgi:hypothetical protein
MGTGGRPGRNLVRQCGEWLERSGRRKVLIIYERGGRSSFRVFARLQRSCSCSLTEIIINNNGQEKGE